MIFIELLTGIPKYSTVAELMDNNRIMIDVKSRSSDLHTDLWVDGGPEPGHAMLATLRKFVR